VDLLHAFLARYEVPIVYVFLLRFPILCMLFLVGFRWIALRFKPDLLANLFDVNRWTEMFWVTLSALLCAWAIFLTGWNIYSHGPLRFSVGGWQRLGPPPFWGYGLAALLGLVCVSGVFAYAPRQNPTSKPLNRVLGLLAGLVFACALLACLRWIAPRPSGDSWPERVIAWACQLVGSHGYLDETGRLFPEHYVSFVLLVLSLLTYTTLGLVKRSERGRPSGVPTLVYMLLLLMLAAWFLPALSFALDPYHVPVLLTLIAWLVLFSRSPRSDHFFDTFPLPYWCDTTPSPNPDRCAPDPSEVLLFPEDAKVVVVAASGGGIQAAVWTARVLAGLEEQNPGKFARAVRLISSVSGGSVGSMYFSSRYQHDGNITQNLAEIVADAEASSLEDVAWGLAYRDLLRVLFPLFCSTFGGRGRALERAWMHTPELQQLLAAKLSDWFAGVRHGLRPANIFNATLTESGDRLLFSTTYLPVGETDATPARWDFHQLYLNRGTKETLDVAVVTAARMSATFPYVAPAARPTAEGPEIPQLHVVDGGYFDNYGMATLLEWLDNGLTKLKRQQDRGKNDRFSKLKVMIVEIHETPDPHRLVPPRVRQKRSWFFQTYAPLLTMFAVRTAGQRSHNQVELTLMEQKWGAKIQRALFEFGTHDPQKPVPPEALKQALRADQTATSDAATPVDPSTMQTAEKLKQAVDPPLSWHLTEQQKQNIEDEWNIQKFGKQARDVRQFLS
jgi:hypothetical protein